MKVTRLLVRAGKWIGLLLSGFLVCAVLGYAVLLLINREDRAPSPAATSFARMLHHGERLDTADNAFPYLAGLDAARGKNPRELGLERMQRDAGTAPREGDRAGVSLRTHLNESGSGLDRWIDVCDTPEDSCLSRLREDGDVLAMGLPKTAWMLRRYQRLLQYTDWREPAPDFYSAWPYGAASVLNRLHGLQVWQLARHEREDAALTRLDREARFWRLTLASTNTVTGKLVATAFLRRNLLWTNAVLATLPRDGASRVPDSWLQPLAAQERSMRRVFAGELHMTRWVFRLTEAAFERASFFDRLVTWIEAPLLQPQASINRLATRYDRIDQALDAPYPRLLSAVEDLRRTRRFREQSSDWLAPYNPTGRYLIGVAEPDWVEYGLRVADLEGARRALIATVRLRAQGVKARNVPARLDEVDLRNPYTGEAFGWDSEQQSVTFEGMSSRSKGSMALPY